METVALCQSSSHCGRESEALQVGQSFFLQSLDVVAGSAYQNINPALAVDLLVLDKVPSQPGNESNRGKCNWSSHVWRPLRLETLTENTICKCASPQNLFD